MRPSAPASRSLPVFRITKFALLPILALAAFLRLFELTTIPPPLHFDEAMNGNDAMENVETGRIAPFYPQNSGREGLYINVETALIYIFGPEPWLLRLPAAIFGIFTVWGLYLLAAELFSVPIGLLACFFIATSFWHVLFSRLGLRAIGAPLFAVWTLYFLLDAMRRARGGQAATARLALAGLFCGIGFYTYIAYRVTPVLTAIVFVYWLIQSRREALRAFAVFTGTAIAAVAPLALYFASHPDALLHRSAEISIFVKANPLGEFLGNIWKTVQMIFTRGDFDWRYNIAFRPVVFWPVAILFAGGVIIAAAAIGRRGQRFPYALMLAWLPLGALPAVLSSENMPSAIRSIMVLPPIFTLAAVATWRAYEWCALRAPRQAIVAASAMLFAALGAECCHSYFYLWAKDPSVPITFGSESVDIADRINALPKTAPKYVVAVTPGAGFGMPAPAQSVMFLTQSYTQKQREDTNIHYIIRQPGDVEDGIDFCRKVALKVRQDVYCLQVNRKMPPKF
jgi:4-amino-4-deoxy-L-arabinose transferase-like glycosyltransferase